MTARRPTGEGTGPALDEPASAAGSAPLPGDDGARQEPATVPILHVEALGQSVDGIYLTPLEVEGWAWCEAGLERVIVQVDDGSPHDAFMGIPRPDVAAELGVLEAVNAGFNCPLGSDALPPGEHRLAVVAIARGGAARSWSAEIRTRRWSAELPGQPASRADAPRPWAADPEAEGANPLFDRLVQVEGDLAVAHYELTDARAQSEYALRRMQLAERELMAAKRELDAVVGSTSWRITRPLRALTRALKRARD